MRRNELATKRLRRSMSNHLKRIFVISSLVSRGSAAFLIPSALKPSPHALEGLSDTASIKTDAILTKSRLGNVDRRGASSLPTPWNPEIPFQELMTPTSEDTTTWPTTIMILCWGVTFLSALDRVAMSVAMIPLAEELDFTESMKGQVSSVFSIGYGLTILPVGIALSRTSPRLMMGMGMALWSIATLVTPLTASCDTIAPLLMVRATVGAAESVVLPTIHRILSAWIPTNRKSVATAIVFSGFQAGTIAAYFVSPYVIASAGSWRGMFLSYGALGLIYLAPWFALAKDSRTRESAFLQDDVQVSGIVDDFQQVSRDPTTIPISSAIAFFRAAPLGKMLSSRGVQGMTMAHAANNWGMYVILAWVPTFYAEQYGLNIKESTFFSVLPSIGGAVGGFVAGLVADAWIRRHPNCSDKGMTRLRKVFQALALLCPATFLAILACDIPDEPLVAQSLLTGTIGLQAFNTAGYGPATQEKAGAKWSGLLYSVSSLPSVMFGALGVYTTGQILEQTHQDWSLVFSIQALVDVAGAMGFLMLYNATKEFD